MERRDDVSLIDYQNEEEYCSDQVHLEQHKNVEQQQSLTLEKDFCEDQGLVSTFQDQGYQDKPGKEKKKRKEEDVCQRNRKLHHQWRSVGDMV